MTGRRRPLPLAVVLAWRLSSSALIVACSTTANTEAGASAAGTPADGSAGAGAPGSAGSTSTSPSAGRGGQDGLLTAGAAATGAPAVGGAGGAAEGASDGGAAASSSAGTSGAGAAPSGGGGSGGIPPLPDVGNDGDGDSMVGPSYQTQPDLTDRGNPKGKSFDFSMPLDQSAIFDGKDATLDPSKVSRTRSISVYVPALYHDGDPAPVLIIQDGPGELGLVKNAVDNLSRTSDTSRKLPAFVVIAVQNGGNDAVGSERGLEYDTLSDRYARFIELEVMPAVQHDAKIQAAYPGLRFTKSAAGRATLGCSSGGAAAFTMAWFRPDLFARVIAYSTTLVAQQDPKAPESQTYPLGAWEYHSSQQLIARDTTRKHEKLRIFLNVNDDDLRAKDPESTHHNWVMANQRTAEALASKSFHYKFVQGRGAGHCDQGVQNATLADALVWVWRGYQPSLD
jgi:enterochelin esterase-like enzyme